MRLTVLEVKRGPMEADGLAQCLLYDLQARNRRENEGFEVFIVHATADERRSPAYDAVMSLLRLQSDLRVLVDRNAIEESLRVA